MHLQILTLSKLICPVDSPTLTKLFVNSLKICVYFQARSKLPKRRRRVLPVEQPRPKARGECPQAAAAGVANRRVNAIKHPNPPNSIFKDAFTTLAQPSKLGIVILYSLLLTYVVKWQLVRAVPPGLCHAELHWFEPRPLPGTLLTVMFTSYCIDSLPCSVYQLSAQAILALGNIQTKSKN